MRRLIWSALALASLDVSAAGDSKFVLVPPCRAKPVEAINTIGLGLMERLNAHPTECPPSILVRDRVTVFFCGALPPDRPIAEAIETIDDYLLAQRRARFTEKSWVEERGFLIRYYSIRGVPLTVRAMTEPAVVVLNYPMQAFPPTLPDPLQVGEVLVSPELTRKATPHYPFKARNLRMEADLTFQAVIRADGRVGDLCLLYSSHPGIGFEEESGAAIKKWRYKPAQLNGEPVAFPFTVKVEFRLH